MHKSDIQNLIAKRNIAGLIKALGDPHAEIVQAAKALVNIGKPAVKPLIAAQENLSHSYSHDDTNARMRMIEVLGKIGDALAVEPLIIALRDWNEFVRKEAVEALGKIGDSRAVKPLISVLKDKDEYMRMSVIDALGEIGDNHAIKSLVVAIDDKRLRISAIIALGKIGDKQAVKPLIEALKDEEEIVRERTVEVLDKIGWQPSLDNNGAFYWVAKKEWDKCVEIGSSAVQPLIFGIQVGYQEDRESATKVLDRIGPSAVELLIDALKNDSQKFRQAAAVRLGEIGDPRAVKPLIAALKENRIGHDYRISKLVCKGEHDLGKQCVCKICGEAIHDIERGSFSCSRCGYEDEEAFNSYLKLTSD